MIDFARLRQSMVDSQIRANDVTDPRILAAMLELPRERFAPENRRGLAYIDDDLPLRDGAAGKPGRYLVEPMVLAKLVQALDIDAEDKVLDVGTATGYSAALLGRLAGRVVALEEDPGLAAAAARNLTELGAGNVTVVSVSATTNTGPAGSGPTLKRRGRRGSISRSSAATRFTGRLAGKPASTDRDSRTARWSVTRKRTRTPRLTHWIPRRGPAPGRIRGLVLRPMVAGLRMR